VQQSHKLERSDRRSGHGALADPGRFQVRVCSPTDFLRSAVIMPSFRCWLTAWSWPAEVGACQRSLRRVPAARSAGKKSKARLHAL